MQKILIFVIYMLVAFFPVSLQAQDSLYMKANEAYQSEKYDSAIDLYQQILAKGYEAADVYFNLGNAYYKTHSLSQAILHYERAKLLDPRDEDIKYNLELARSLVVDKLETIPDFFLKSWYHKIVRILKLVSWAFISIFIFLAALIFFLVYFFSKKFSLKKISFWLAALFLLFAILTYTFSYQHKQLLLAHDQAIVTAPSLTAKSTPDENGTDLFVIHEGLKVTVEDEVGEWREIKLSDGNKGWVRAASIEQI